MVKIVETYWSYYNSSIQRYETRCLIECDTPIDLPGSVDAITGYRLTIGCRAHVINDNTNFYMKSDGTWVRTFNAYDYYNISQVDALLLQKQDVLTFDAVPASGSTNPVESGGIFSAIAAAVTGAFGPGPRIQGSAGDPFDLNDLKPPTYPPGAYTIQTYQDLPNINNVPNDTDVGNVRAQVYMLPFYGTGRCFQIYVPNRTSNAQSFAEFYMRSYGSSWSAWRGIYGTQI